MKSKGYAKGGKKQGYNARLDESLGMRRGKGSTKSQSMKSRRDESKGMEKAMGRRAYQSVGTMDMKRGGSTRSKGGFKAMPGDGQFKRKSW
tara:strand:- start:6319 stop:6591 length:273 start_codon:yes stop_codon:yes gene_type:complete